MSPFKAFADDTDEGVAEETEAAELLLVATGEDGNAPPLVGTKPPSSTHETAKSRSGRSTNDDDDADEAFVNVDDSSCTASYIILTFDSSFAISVRISVSRDRRLLTSFSASRID